MQRENRRQTSNFYRRLRAAAVIWACCIALAGFAPAIEAQPQGDEAIDSGPIQITADELVTRVKENYAEFTGNVEAVQGDFIIRSQRLRIHYRRSDEQPIQDRNSSNAIEKIVASGQVRITSGNREAQTELAEYRVDEGLVILKGENSTVTDGTNSIRGSVIKLSRVDGKITVEGGPTERVRAVFRSTGRNPAGPNTD